MRLTIFSRLSFGYMVLFFFVFSIGAFSVYQIEKVKLKTAEIITNDTQLIEINKKLVDTILSAERNEEKFVLLGDRAFYEQYKRDIAEFERNLKRIRALLKGEQAEGVLNNINNHYIKYRKSFDEETTLINSKTSYDRAEYKEKKEQALSELLNNINSLKTLSREYIIKGLKEIDRNEESVERLILLVTVWFLIIGVLLSAVITRGIVKPLSRIKKKTRLIAEGDLEPDLSVKSPPEIAEVASSINSMCEKLKEIDRLKADFFSVMSHELRTPLTAIKEGVSLLLDGVCGPTNQRQDKILGIISDESQRLIKLVNDLLDLSKMEAGMLKYNFESIDLPSLVNQVIKELSPIAEGKAVGFTLRNELSRKVRADSERLLQVLRNLIGNAVKFSPDGSSVEIALEEKEGGVVFSVADSGPGIPEEYRERIFDRFQQARLPNSSLYKGTGLGLSIVKNIINGHGGRVWVEKAPSGGSLFRFWLPL
ncbi:MAG: HAMP domain-containing protein [Nitrospirae bacterium]|nr:MAG: HAMP domain-containing protein [Nitrospirota bacterium]